MYLIRQNKAYWLEIPMAIISQAGLREDTEIACRVTEQGLLIPCVTHARFGWSEAFKAGTEETITNDFDLTDWEW